MAKTPPVEIVRHNGHNAFSGEFSNAICMRRQPNGKISLWVQAENIDGTVEDCFQEDIDSPEKFLTACENCLEFVEFGDVGVLEAVRSAYSDLLSSDSAFAETLRAYVLEEYAEDCAKVQDAQEGVVRDSQKSRTLTAEQARAEYGASLIFIGDASPVAAHPQNILKVPFSSSGVKLRVQWADEVHETIVSRSDWARITAGEKVSINGADYVYEGRPFSTVWHFNAGEIGQLVVSYAAGGDPLGEGDGFVGSISSAIASD
jgi:hypothetical protein